LARYYNRQRRVGSPPTLELRLVTVPQMCSFTLVMIAENLLTLTRTSNRPDWKDFCHWFWYHARELHRANPDCLTSQKAAIRLYPCLRRTLTRSEADALGILRQERERMGSLLEAH